MPTKVSAAPFVFYNYVMSLRLIRKYSAIAVVFTIIIVSFRPHLFPANPHPYCGSQKAPENSSVWKAPLKVFYFMNLATQVI